MHFLNTVDSPRYTHPICLPQTTILSPHRKLLLFIVYGIPRFHPDPQILRLHLSEEHQRRRAQLLNATPSISFSIIAQRFIHSTLLLRTSSLWLVRLHLDPSRQSRLIISPRLDPNSRCLVKSGTFFPWRRRLFSNPNRFCRIGPGDVVRKTRRTLPRVSSFPIITRGALFLRLDLLLFVVSSSSFPSSSSSSTRIKHTIPLVDLMFRRQRHLPSSRLFARRRRRRRLHQPPPPPPKQSVRLFWWSLHVCVVVIASSSSSSSSSSQSRPVLETVIVVGNAMNETTGQKKKEREREREHYKLEEFW